MKGKMFLIQNSEEEPVGLWQTNDDAVTPELIEEWFRNFYYSGAYHELGSSGFDGYVLEKHGHVILRVFVEIVTL